MTDSEELRALDRQVAEALGFTYRDGVGFPIPEDSPFFNIFGVYAFTEAEEPQEEWDDRKRGGDYELFSPTTDARQWAVLLEMLIQHSGYLAMMRITHLDKTTFHYCVDIPNVFARHHGGTPGEAVVRAFLAWKRA